MNISPIPMLPTCVKKSDGEKKKRVVTPKEGGATPISTWDTQAPYDVALETVLPSEVQNWAASAEESKVRAETTPRAVKSRRRRRKSTASRATADVECTGNEKQATVTTPRRKGPSQVVWSPERRFAEVWAQENHIVGEKGSRRLASMAELKAYALWYEKGFSVEDTAEHLGISPTSAAQYIKQAVWANGLESVINNEIHSNVELIFCYIIATMWKGSIMCGLSPQFFTKREGQGLTEKTLQMSFTVHYSS